MKKFILLLLSVTFLYSCSTQDDIDIDNNQTSTEDVISKSYKEIGFLIINEASQSNDLYQIMRSECEKQKYGDYYLRVNDLIQLNDKNNFWSTATNERIKTLNAYLENETNNNIIVFIPSVETEEDNRQKNGSFRPKSNKILAVFTEEYSPELQTAPGYLATDGRLTFSQVINEEFAWENDVWVIGQEEAVSAENMIANDSSIIFISDIQDPNNPGGISGTGNIFGGGGSHGGGSSTPRFRIDGREEWGGIIQITDLGAVEPWVHGKLELKYFVFISGTSNVKERGWGKRKRKNFRDRKWADFNDNIGPWNTSNLGNVMVEAWIEEDGGSSSTISHTFPSQCTGCPANTISTTIKDEDDNLGRSFVQFSDQIGRVYGITHANFKRK